jgi:hypothetical protein
MLKKQIKIKFKKDGNQVKLVVKPTNYKVDQQLRMAHAVAYRKSIQMGVATKAAMLELMRQENIWGQKEEDKLTELLVQAALLEEVLKQVMGNFEKEKETAISLTKVRTQIYELIAIKTAPIEFTAEEIARGVEIDTYIALSTFHEDTNKLYFKDVEEFTSRRNDDDVAKIYEVVLNEMSKDDLELIAKLPEHQWLLKNKFIDDNGNVVARDTVDMLKAEEKLSPTE